MILAMMMIMIINDSSDNNNNNNNDSFHNDNSNKHRDMSENVSFVECISKDKEDEDEEDCPVIKLLVEEKKRIRFP